MITLGLTGAIAAGKSEVARLLAARGAFLVDADRVAQETYAPGGPAYDAVVRAFGPEVVAPDGAIDRRRLGALVFADAARLKQLTDIVWPPTTESLAAIIRRQAEAGTRVLVLEAAVLLQAGWDRLVDEVWLVRAPLAAARQRLQRSRGLTPDEVEARLGAAAAPDPARAHVGIDNDAGLADLEAKVDAAWAALLKRAKL